MRKNLVVALFLAAIFAAASTTVFAYTYADPRTGVSHSRHDINEFALAAGGTLVAADSQERVCAFCHTPHHAITGATTDYLPLWSHTLTTINFTPYASTTLQAVTTDPLKGPSRLCMSCHDGVVAVDTHYGNTPATAYVLNGDAFDYTQVNPKGSGGIGGGAVTGLAGDHPIGFNYVDAQAADAAKTTNLTPGIRPETNTFRTINGGAGSIQIKDVLFNYDGSGGPDKNLMTCATCHEVHNKDNVVQVHSAAKGGGAMTDVNYFLYSFQAGSQICLSCHDK